MMCVSGRNAEQIRQLATLIWPISRASPNVMSTLAIDMQAIARLGSPSDAISLAWG